MVNCQEEEAVDTSEEEIDCLPSLIHVVSFSFGEKEEVSDSIKAPLLTRGEVGGYCQFAINWKSKLLACGLNS